MTDHFAAAAADFAHRADDEPCVIKALHIPRGGWRARCATHNVQAHLTGSTKGAARRALRCDLGRRWLFIVHSLNDCPPPVMTDLGGLAEYAEAAVAEWYTGGDAVMVAYRYLYDGTTAPLTVRHAPAPADPGLVRILVRQARDRAEVGEVGVSDPANPAEVMAATGYAQDGTTYLRTTVRVEPESVERARQAGLLHG